MGVRVHYKIEVAISSTPNEEKDLGNVKWEVISDGVGEGGGWKTTLAAAASNVEIPLDSIAAARMLVIRTNSKDPLNLPNEIRIRRNTISNEEIAIVPLPYATEGHFLISTSGLTALFASNPGSVDMEITLFVCGD